VIIFPALALLFRLTLAGRFRAGTHAEKAATTTEGRPPNARLLARLAVACLIAGVGLLNIADATWAHGLGVASLLSFIAFGFGAIAVPVPVENAPPG